MPGQHGVQRLELQVAPDLGADELHAPDLDLAPPTTLPSAPWRRDAELLRLLLGLGEPDQVFAGVAELLDDGAAQLELVEALPDLADRDRLVVPHLDQGSAREVDAVVQAPVQPDGQEREDDRPQRGGVEPAALAHEVVVRVDEDLEHGMG